MVFSCARYQSSAGYGEGMGASLVNIVPCNKHQHSCWNRKEVPPIMYPVENDSQVRSIVEKRLKLLDRVFFREVEHELLLHL